MKKYNEFLYWLTVASVALLLSGCGGGGSGSANQAMQSSETLMHDGINREYILYVPASYDGTKEVPLLLNFHGLSQSMEFHMSNSDMRSLADSQNFILVYPEGTKIAGITNWNYVNPSNSIGADDLGFVETLISKLSLEYKVDTQRIYAVGYSQGAMLSYALACYKSSLIAAIGSFAGRQTNTSSTCTPSHPTSMISIHGTSDPLVPYSTATATLNFWRDFNNTSDTLVFNTVNDRGTPIEHYQYNQGTNGVSVEHYKIVGGNHFWRNIDYQGNNTNDLLWNFVSRYDTNGLR